jgi:hypothetical protein
VLLEARLPLDVGDLGVRHLRLEFGQGAVDEDPALVKDRDPVGELFRFVEMLCGQQHRGASVGELADGLPDLEAGVRVEASGRLVEDDHGRVPDQTHGDVETPAHAAGVGRHSPISGVGEREAGELFFGDRARVLEVAKPGDHHEVFAPGEDLVDRCELSGETDRLADLSGLRHDIEPVHHRSAGVGLGQRGEDLHDRGLTGPVRAEECHDVAPCDLKVDPAEHLEVTERLHQAGDPDSWRAHTRPC